MTDRSEAACRCSCHDPAVWGEYVVHVGPCCDRTDVSGYVARGNGGDAGASSVPTTEAGQ